MTTLDLYRKHKAGGISREKFLYEVRRDNNLPFITNLTSYDDAVKILKNKGIVTEASLKSLIAPLAAKLESMGYDVDYGSSFGFMTFEAFKTLPDGSVLRMYLAPSDKELQQKNYGGRSEDFSTIDVSFTHWTTKVTNKLFGLYKQKTQVMNNLPDEEGNNIDLGTGMFDIPIEQSVDRVVDLVKKAEAKVSSTSLNEVDTKEAKKDEAVKAEVKAKAPSKKQPKELHIDHANPYEYRHGIAYELDCLDDYSAESLEKAKEKVLKNLAKDANFYSNLLNQKQSHYEFKAPETDKPGYQARPDGGLKKELKKNEKANVKDNLGKKEAGKVKPKGVKIMPDKGVTGSEKTIKEGLEELKKKAINKYVNVEIEDDGEEYPMLNKTAIANYLKSVIDPSELKAINAFMRDDEGFEESASYFFDDNYVDTTEQEVEDWAKQEMSYYLFSSPDEFPGKENVKEAKEDKHAKLKEALKKALKEEDPALSKLEKDEENAEKALAVVLTKKAAILNKPGTQG